MTLLSQIQGPSDLADLTNDQLTQLSAEIREELIETVTKTGGHLGPNLGVVELTIALHRVFESPKDTILWDTGHQSYVHKLLTGRQSAFSTIRQEGGLSGYPDRGESIHDVIENSHASTALSYADGIAKGYSITRQKHRKVVAVVGDGALTGGMSWEALNNIADAKDRPVVIVVNDNERSYSPTIGGFAHHLATLRTTAGYEKFLEWGKGVLDRTPLVGAPVYDALHGMKKGLKDFVAPQGMFEDLGLKYIGPVDGHDISELEFALSRARDFGAPVIVHVLTQKGRGYQPALDDEADRFHAVGIVNKETGKPVNQASQSWTDVFSAALVALGSQDERIVAISAAMLAPTGLDKFSANFPERTFDVGIAEEHALTSAAGLAFAGLHPVVAIYATFLNRAFDQLLMDCALHKAGVTVVLDRAGITGDDGPSHNGMWDLALLRNVPGLHLCAPRDAATLERALTESVQITDAPSVIRFPKGAVGPNLLGTPLAARAELVYGSTQAPIAILAVGSMVATAVEAATSLREQNVEVAVIDPVWAYPVCSDLVEVLNGFTTVVTIEDGLVQGGVGAAYAQALSSLGSVTHVANLGIPTQFLKAGKRATLLAEMGLTSRSLADFISDLN